MSLERALLYAEQGWAVFPVIPNDKRPLTPNGFKDATKERDRIERWWTENPNANIGIATGEPSGLAIIDVDVRDGKPGRESVASLRGLPGTLTARTQSGGWHLYFLRPEGGLRCKNGFLPGVDLKADGGYVVAPGSSINGSPYEWLDPEVPVAALPEHILATLRGMTVPAGAATSETIREGHRNDALTRLGGTLRRRGLEAPAIAAELHVANAARCRPPLPSAEVDAISRSVARYPAPVAAADGDATVSEDALAAAFTERHGADWRHVAAWGQWLHWQGARWIPETTLLAFDLARGICREGAARAESRNAARAARVCSSATVAAVERLARADRRHAATPEQWDGDPWLLNTPGGVVDLKTGRVRPHDRADHMTKLATATPRGAAPAWSAFLESVTDGDRDLQEYLARIAGYALTGATTEQALFFLYGTGANGKSVFVNTLAAILGDYATNAPIDTFMETRSERHPTDLASLRGARLVSSIEVENGRRWAEAKIKALTGGDTISARFMRQDFFEYRPQFKLLIAGNHKPAIRDVDEAMRRRFHMVPFTVTIPPERRDKTLLERLLAERDGILRWAVDGCLAWQESGLRPPAVVMGATAEYFSEEDSTGRWMAERCVLAPNGFALTAALFASWKAWAEASEEPVGSLKRFSQTLESRGFSKHRSVAGLRGYRGLTLIQEQTDEILI